jgi:hypothetical protein
MEYKLGEIGTNKQGLRYEIVHIKNTKNITVRFEDGLEAVSSKSNMQKGSPFHPTHGKLQAQQQFKDKSGNIFELVEHIPNTSDWKIRWLKDGKIASRNKDTITGGKVKHPTDGIPFEGEVYKSTNGNITVVKYNSATDILIQFDDGTLNKTTSDSLRKGLVGHPTSGLVVGQKIKTNSGWEGLIVDYQDCYRVGVKWQDGSTSYHPAGHIKNRSIKPLFQPSLQGVGYFGEGPYTNARMATGVHPDDLIYQYWSRMIGRCFDPKEVTKRSGMRYAFTTVHKDWFNFQNFAKWAYAQPNWNLKHHLDKDLLGDGTEYSERTCTFLPIEINSFLSENWSKEVHDLPIGVQYIRPATQGAKKGYVARCHTDKGREYLGYYDDPMEAHLVYKRTKESYAVTLANRFKNVITDEAYLKLKQYKILSPYFETYTPSWNLA